MAAYFVCFITAHIYIILSLAYYLSPNELDWYQAEDFCVEHCGSNLASIHNDTQYNELITLIQSAAADIMLNIPSTIDTYIGLIDNNGDGNWLWSDGTSFNYNNWDTNNPNLTGDPICVQIEGSDNEYKWNDVRCNDTSSSVIFACNSCDGVLTKYAMDDTRDTYDGNARRCSEQYGTELMSFHSESDWDEAVSLCKLINSQSSNDIALYGDIKDDCQIGLYDDAFDDGTTFDYATNYTNYPWKELLIITEISGSGWSFSKRPCELSNNYISDQNILIMLEEKRWNNNGQNIVFEMMYTINTINPSQSSTEPSTAGIIWHVDTSCSNYYYIGINAYDDSVFLAQIKNDVLNILHSQSLSFSYSAGTYYALKVIVSASNIFTIYVNDVMLLSYVSASDDFNSVDTTNGYIGIKNMGSSISVKSLFVSGETIAEATNDASAWFDSCVADTTKAPTKNPSTSNNPSLYPTQQSPSEIPTLSLTKSPTDIIPSPQSTITLTQSPTNPDSILCGETITGSYNNAPLSFNIIMPFAGYLEFDASQSDPLSITSLSVVFGNSVIASVNDADGIITLQNIVSGTYTFTIVANNGVNQRYAVMTYCYSANPTLSPADLDVFTSLNSVIETIDPDESDDDTQLQPVNVLGLYVIIYLGCVIICVCVMCAGAFLYYEIYYRAKRKRENTMVVMTEVNKDANNVLAPSAVVIKSWLTETVGLPQYYDIFVENGFDTFKIIKRVNNEQELIDIGITKKDHLHLIMSEIRELQNQEGVNVVKTQGNEEGDIEQIPILLKLGSMKSEDYEDMYVKQDNKVINETSKYETTQHDTLTGSNTRVADKTPGDQEGHEEAITGEGDNNAAIAMDLRKQIATSMDNENSSEDNEDMYVEQEVNVTDPGNMWSETHPDTLQ